MKSNNTKAQKKLKLRFWIITLVVILLLSTLLYGGYKIYIWKQEGLHLKRIESEISSLANVVEKEIEDISKVDISGVQNSKVQENDYYYYMKIPFLEADFTKLLQKNPDTVGYIKVNNTNINYPIVYSGDNTYYLTHALDNSKNSAGWIFLDYRNDLSILSDNTVIYGHGRVDSTVFGTLKNALKKTWQQNKDNSIIQLSTLEYNYVFQIFSIYTIEKESYYIETSFQTKEEKEQWIQKMAERNTSIFQVDVNADDSFLTLSTCKNNHGTRIVVQAKLIKKAIRK